MNSDYSISLKDRDNYVQGIEDVKQSWHIILTTVPGSIPLNPLFGSNLYTYIDKPVNASFSDMANTIIKDLELWEKRTKIKRVVKKIEGSSIKLSIFGIYRPSLDEINSSVEIITSNQGGIGSMIIGQTFILK